MPTKGRVGLLEKVQNIVLLCQGLCSLQWCHGRIACFRQLGQTLLDSLADAVGLVHSILLRHGSGISSNNNQVAYGQVVSDIDQK